MITGTCEHCRIPFSRKHRSRDSGRFCSRTCAFAAKAAGGWNRGLAKPKPNHRRCECGASKVPNARTCRQCKHDRTIRACTECGALHLKQNFTCSTACRSARLKRIQYKARTFKDLTCARCSQQFQSGVGVTNREAVCQRCIKQAQRKRSGRKHTERAKRAGVPYVYGINPQRVFDRDGWRCQLCGCKTQRYRGTEHPHSPQLDHIVPLSKGGPHTWDNVQCACKSCNHRKSSKVLGQFRISFDQPDTPHSGGKRMLAK